MDYNNLTTEDIINGVNNIEDNNKKLSKLKSSLERTRKKLVTIDDEIRDLERYQNTIGRVTRIEKGIPVYESLNLPSEDNTYGSYDLARVTGYYQSGKSLSSWRNAHLDEETLLSSKFIWCFELVDGDGKKVFLPHQYSGLANKGGFSLGFLKMIAYEYVVNDRPISDFSGDLTEWFKKHNRNESIGDLLV